MVVVVVGALVVAEGGVSLGLFDKWVVSLIAC